MDRSFVSHLLAAACAVALAPLAMAQSASAAGSAPTAAQEPQTRQQNANLQVRLAEVMAMLEEDALTPEQRKQALAKLAEVQAQLARQAADPLAAPRMVMGGIAAPSTANDKPAQAHARGVPMPLVPAVPEAPSAPAAVTAPATPAVPEPQRAFAWRTGKAPAPAQVEIVEVPVAGTRAVVVERNGEQVVEVLRSEPGQSESKVYTSRVARGAPVLIETPDTVVIRTGQARAKSDEEAAVRRERAAQAEEYGMRRYIDQELEPQRDAERMREAAVARGQAAKRLVELRAQREAGDYSRAGQSPVETTERVKVLELQGRAGSAGGARTRGGAPLRREASAEAEVRETIDELRSELQAIRALLQDVRRRVEQDDRAAAGQGMDSSEAVKSARGRAGR